MSFLLIFIQLLITQHTVSSQDYKCEFVVGDGYSDKGENEIRIADQESRQDCMEACIQKKASDSTINGVSYSATGTKACWCEKLMTKIDTNDKKYVTCQLQPVLEYTCDFVTGDGYSDKGENEVRIEDKASKEECMAACVEKKKTDANINGVTYSATGTKACWCERFMTKIDTNDKKYVTCQLKPISEPLDYSCAYMIGDGYSDKGENEIRIDDQSSSDDCRRACIVKKNSDKDINGVSYSNLGTKACWCERKMTKVDYNDKKYITCFLEPFNYSCDWLTGDGYSDKGENEVKIGLYDSEALCRNACIERKIKSDPTINGVSYSRLGNKGCWCERKMTKVDYGDSKYITCFLKVEQLY